MEELNFLLPEYGIWILSGGLLMVLLLQTITLHKIRKIEKILKRRDAEEQLENEKDSVREQMNVQTQQVEERVAGMAEVPKKISEEQQSEESPEQLIDAVLAEVFR